MLELSPLQTLRLKYVPKISEKLKDLKSLDFSEVRISSTKEDVVPYFPHLKSLPLLGVSKTTKDTLRPLRVGVVLSGGQAAGGHNVIISIFDAIKSFHEESRLFGFLNGPSGIIKGSFKELEEKELQLFRNQGGFDLIGSGRTKIETPEQFLAVFQVVQNLQLDGLVIIGGDDSNTNAAHLAEYFLEHGSSTSVIGVPKTIDGDLQNEKVQISFGFDTACKIYSETIGNIARDAISQKKYYYFIKLMGRSASHIALECALQTNPNYTLISEEIAFKKITLKAVVDDMVALIQERSKLEKNYGVILIPEGVIEFIPDLKILISELNQLLSGKSSEKQVLQPLSTSEKIEFLKTHLTAASKETFASLPKVIQEQLILDPDPHGNVQVSKIETERLFIKMVEDSLKQKKEYTATFSAQPIFCGYEGRSALPSNFDADYCYNLGLLSALLILKKKTGYMAAISHLEKPTNEWEPYAVPLQSLMRIEERGGKKKPVIEKTFVDLQGKAFQEFNKRRASLRRDDRYREPGPIQFFGAKEITDCIPLTVQLNT